MALRNQVVIRLRDDSGDAIVGFRYDDVTNDVVGIGGQNNMSRPVRVTVAGREGILSPGQTIYRNVTGLTSERQGAFQKILHTLGATTWR